LVLIELLKLKGLCESGIKQI